MPFPSVKWTRLLSRKSTSFLFLMCVAFAPHLMSNKDIYCTWLHLPFSMCTSIKSDQKWGIASISVSELLNPLFPVSKVFKCVYAALWMINDFPPYNHFPHRRNDASQSLLYRYFHGKCPNEFPQVQTFKAKTHHAMYNVESSSLLSHSIGKLEVSFGPFLPKSFCFAEDSRG